MATLLPPASPSLTLTTSITRINPHFLPIRIPDNHLLGPIQQTKESSNIRITKPDV